MAMREILERERRPFPIASGIANVARIGFAAIGLAERSGAIKPITTGAPVKLPENIKKMLDLQDIINIVAGTVGLIRDIFYELLKAEGMGKWMAMADGVLEVANIAYTLLTARERYGSKEVEVYEKVIMGARDALYFVASIFNAFRDIFLFK